MKTIIVGGGVMGCGIGWRLAQAGVEVLILERSIPGAEASSAAGGILAPQKEAAGPGPFLDLCLKSRAMYGEFSRELLELTGVDIGYVRSGLLSLAFSEATLARLEAIASWQKANGLRAELVDGAQARALEPALSPTALGGLHLPDDHQVDNRTLVKALSMAAAKSGATFRTGYVRGLIEEGGRIVGVDFDGERLLGDAVVLAAGSWSGVVQGSPIDPRVLKPARGQIVQLGVRVPLFDRVLFCERGYLVPRRDGRILVGSTMELVGYDKQVTAEGLRNLLDMAIQVIPQLKDAPIQDMWAGLRPYTEDHLPIVGAAPQPGLFLATGHFRNGILLAPITAKVVAELVLGKEPSADLRPFKATRFAAKA